MTCNNCGADTGEQEERCAACAAADAEAVEVEVETKVDIEQVFEQIRTLRIIGQDDEALVVCESLLQTHPDNLEACVLMGDMLVSQKQTNQGVMWYQRALRLSPDNAMVQRKLDHALNVALASTSAGSVEPGFAGSHPARSQRFSTVFIVLICLTVIAACTVYLMQTTRQQLASGNTKPSMPFPADSPRKEPERRTVRTTTIPPAESAEKTEPATMTPAPQGVTAVHETKTTGESPVPAVVAQPAVREQPVLTERLVVVTPVSGLSVGEAKRKIEASGLEVNIVPVLSATVRPNRVMRTLPVAGVKVPSDTVVSLYVAQTPKMKNYLAMPAEDAVADLKSAGYQPVIVERETDKSAPGLVLRTSPENGAVLKSAQSVTLYVAKAPERASGWALPNLRDLDQAHAQALLVGRGYRVQLVLREDDLIESGRITGTSPLPGTPVEKGDQVTLYVAK